jgi:hypothetical protein
MNKSILNSTLDIGTMDRLETLVRKSSEASRDLIYAPAKANVHFSTQGLS